MKKRSLIRAFFASTLMISTLLSSSCANAKTVTEYSIAVDNDKRNEEAWLNLANAYYESGNVSAAIDTLKEALNYLDSKTIIDRIRFFRENPVAANEGTEATESESTTAASAETTTATTTVKETVATSESTAVTTTTAAATTAETSDDQGGGGWYSPELVLSSRYNSIYEYENVPFINAYASSMLSEGDVDYHPENVLDENKSYTWVEGVTGDGIGEYIELYFWEESTIDMLRIHPGYAQLNGNTYTEVYEKNNRPQLIELEFSDGTTAQYELSDSNSEQDILFSRPVTTDYVKITILSVYSGTDYQDTCITYVTAYRSVKDTDKDYNIHFDSDGVLRWDEYPGAIEYLVVAHSWGDNRAEDRCASNDSVNYAYYMGRAALSEETYTLYIYAINEDYSQTYLGEIEYYYVPDTSAVKARIIDFEGVWEIDKNTYRHSTTSNYNMYFDNHGALHWNEYDGAYDYKIVAINGDRYIYTNQIYYNACNNYINNSLVEYADFPSGEMKLELYVIMEDEEEILIDSCEFYFARKSDELKEKINGTWQLAYYDNYTPEQYYEKYKDTFDQLGYDLSDCYVTAYLDSDACTITVKDFRGENEYKVEFYDNGIGIITGTDVVERWEYNSRKDSMTIESLGTTVTYMR